MIKKRRIAALSLPAFARAVADAVYARGEPAWEADGVRVHCAGRERCLADYAVTRPSFASVGVELVVEGVGELVLADRRHRLAAGSLFVYGPNVAHEIRAVPGGRPMLKYFVDFSPDRRGWWEGLALGPGDCVRIADLAAVRGLFDGLLRVARAGAAADAKLLVGYLQLALRESLSRAPKMMRDPVLARASYERCAALVEKRFAELAGPGDVARGAGLHLAHVCRLFQRFAGCTPGEALARRRLEVAAALLVTRPNTLVKEIAAAVGYPDPLHFSRRFRTRYGVSPQAYVDRAARRSSVSRAD